MAIFHRIYRQVTSAAIAAGVQTLPRLWSVADVVSAISTHGGSGSAVVALGDGGASTAASGTATLSDTTTIPASSMVVGSIVEVSCAGWGGNATAPTLTLTLDGDTLITRTTSAYTTPTTVVWRGVVTSDSYIAGTSAVDGAGTIGNATPATLGASIAVVATVTGGDDAARGVTAPVVVIYPPVA